MNHAAATNSKNHNLFKYFVGGNFFQRANFECFAEERCWVL